MRRIYKYKPDNYAVFVTKLLLWSRSFDRSCILDSNGYQAGEGKCLFSEYDFLAGIGCLEEIVSNSNSFDTLKEFSCSDNDWLFGFFSYDLKNQIENLASENIDNLYFPLLNFFRPKYVFFKKEDFIEFQYLDDIVPADVISEILKIIRIDDVYIQNEDMFCCLFISNESFDKFSLDILLERANAEKFEKGVAFLYKDNIPQSHIEYEKEFLKLFKKCAKKLKNAD